MKHHIVLFACGLVAGAVLSQRVHRAESHPRQEPCVDIFKDPAQPAVYSVPQIYQHDYGRPGLSHITIAGARHHGMREVEVWLQTFSPGCGTPVHRHNCEEVFVIQRGAGTMRYRSPSGGAGGVAQQAFGQNDTLVIPPSVVHQFVNTGQEDLQALVVFGRPPIDIYTYADWSTPDGGAQRQWPYYWDQRCPPVLFAMLQGLHGGGGGGCSQPTVAAWSAGAAGAAAVEPPQHEL